MPLVESQQWDAPVPRLGAATRLHLCGATLTLSGRPADGPWQHRRDELAAPVAAAAARDRQVLRLRRSGHVAHPVQRYQVTTQTAAGDPAEMHAAFEQAWVHTWEPALTGLRDAIVAEAGQTRHVILLPHYAVRTGSVPWGPAIAAALSALPSAELAGRDGLRIVGAGDRVRQWLDGHYFPAFEPALSALPGDDGDTDATYTFALGIWQPQLPGPLARLAQALQTARHGTG